MVFMLQQPDFEERMAARRSGSGRKAIMGIDPTTKRCEVVATDEPANWLECRDMGLIVVPVPMEKARVSWGELIGDVYALATLNGEVRGASRLAGEASSAEGATSTVVLGNREE